MKSYNKKIEKSDISDDNGVRTYTYKLANGKERKITYSKDKQPIRKNHMSDNSNRAKRTNECLAWIKDNKETCNTCYQLEKIYRQTNNNCVARNTFYKLYKQADNKVDNDDNDK